MADCLNYGPQLSIGNLWQTTKKNSKIESATRNSALSTFTQSEEISSVASTLGSHWKQVATVADSTDDSDESSMITTARSDGRSTSCTILESDLISGTEKINRELDKMEMKSNLQVQKIQLDKVYKILKQDIRKFKSTVRESRNMFDGIFDDWTSMNEMCCDTLDRLDNEQDVFESDTDLDIENMIDITNEITNIIKDKQHTESFLSSKEEQIVNVSIMSFMMDENLKRINTIQQLLDFNRVDLPPLTCFEHDDGRIYDVMTSLTGWIGRLPMTQKERETMNEACHQVYQNDGIGGTTKCALMFDKVLTMMKTWNEKKMMDRMTSSESGSISETFDSSSLSDSNLNDIADELSQARTKMAVEGPRNCIEIGSWSTASNISNWSNLTDGRSSYRSVQEPMTLSSYDIDSMTSSLSDGTMTSSSVASQMPSYIMEHQQDQLKTALSQDDLINVENPPRSTSRLVEEDEQDEEAPPTNKLDTLLDEALHTARSLIESNSITLYDALQESAKKCGVAVESLMSQSSSDVSESATQSSATEMNLQ